MKAKVLSVLTCLLLFCLASQALDSKNRVEELFIWKISDDLKLSVPEEKKVSELIRNLNEKKTRSSENLQENLKRMSEAKSLKEKEKLLSEQKRLLRAYNDLSLDEADQVQKILGVEKAAQYFVLKNDLTNKLKNALVPDKTSDKAEKMAPPKVIEEH